MLVCISVKTMNVQFLLVSQSPRRRELLQLIGYPFSTAVAQADEESVTHPNPVVNVVETARLKTAVVFPQMDANIFTPKTVLLAADTTVALDNQMLNKPADDHEARQMLLVLKNRRHEVYTGVVLVDSKSGQEMSFTSTAVVTMRNYSEVEMAAYIATGDPLDKAGSYAIQHPTFRPVASLKGCYLNVMGLPICELLLALSRWSIPMIADLIAVAQAHQQYPCPHFQELQAQHTRAP